MHKWRKRDVKMYIYIHLSTTHHPQTTTLPTSSLYHRDGRKRETHLKWKNNQRENLHQKWSSLPHHLSGSLSRLHTHSPPSPTPLIHTPIWTRPKKDQGNHAQLGIKGKARARGAGKLRDATISHPEITPSFVRTRFLDGEMVASLMKESPSIRGEWD